MQQSPVRQSQYITNRFMPLPPLQLYSHHDSTPHSRGGNTCLRTRAIDYIMCNTTVYSEMRGRQLYTPHARATMT